MSAAQKQITTPKQTGTVDLTPIGIIIAPIVASAIDKMHKRIIGRMAKS
jgi:hypothetical protein